MLHVACVIAVLLLIAGVQPILAPQRNWTKLFNRLDDLLKELRDNRDTLSAKTDDSVSELNHEAARL